MSEQKVGWTLRCLDCARSYAGDSLRYRCDCGGVLDVVADARAAARASHALFDNRRLSRAAHDRSGVWRYRDLVLPVDERFIVTKPEGNTNLYCSQSIADYCGLDGIALKHEGENPTGSFKDRGMTAGATMANYFGMKSVACASTGNTSASMASYAAQVGMKAYVFIPDGKIAYGKLSQALAYGATTIQIAGDFDAAMRIVEQVAAERGIYLLNSINPFRIEGQKAIGIELADDLGWRVPDWIVVPGGNLGNSSAIGKGLVELKAAGLIDRMPKIAVIQAAGASPLVDVFTTGNALVATPNADTIATAIKIGNPISWQKSIRVVRDTGGYVDRVTDDEIMDAKAIVDASGIGAEPASCASVAGARKLVAKGIIRHDEEVVCILTGHVLKDPDNVIGYHRGELPGIESRHANAPIRCGATLEDVLRVLDRVAG